MKLLFIVLLSKFILGCTTFAIQSNKSGFSGQFSCPGYKGDDNEWNPSTETIEHQSINGINIIVIDSQGDVSEKTGPYTKTVMVADGKWRYSPLYRNNTVYPVKIKNEIKGNTFIWQAEYPELIDNKGKKRPATTGTGKFWMDQNGDKISTGSHYTGSIKCKRIK